MNIGLATGNIGRPGGGVVRLGGHQEGYMRPSDAHVGRPAAYIDDLLIRGHGKVHHIWANDHYKTTLNASEFKRVYNRRTNMVKEAMDARPGATREEMVDAIVAAIEAGGLFSVDVDVVPTQIGQCAHVVLPAVESGEMNLTSMNGERRMRLVEKYMDGPGSAKPDCLIAAGLAQALERVLREEGRTEYADRFKGYDWKTEEDAFMDGYHAQTGKIVTYDRLRAMGNNGVQEPVTAFENGQLVGTKRLYADGKFDRHGRDDKKALFCAGAWRGLQAPGKAQQKANYAFLINNGRSNINWQNWFLDKDNDFVADRYPYPFLEIHPEDMAELGLNPGDLVEIYNDVGATQAMAYPTADSPAEGDLHAVRRPIGDAGQRDQLRGERARPAELQADLGEHPEDFGRPGHGLAPLVQVQGVRPRLRTARGQVSPAPARARHQQGQDDEAPTIADKSSMRRGEARPGNSPRHGLPASAGRGRAAPDRKFFPCTMPWGG